MTIHAQQAGDLVLVFRDELEQLVEIARRIEDVELRLSEDDLPTVSMMRLAEEGGAFSYWEKPGEDVYTQGAVGARPVRSVLPIAQETIGQPLPIHTSAELNSILDAEDAADLCGGSL